MTDQRKSPSGGDRNGASNIVCLFGQSKPNGMLKRPIRQALSTEQRIDCPAEVRAVLSSIHHDGTSNIPLYLWELAQRDMQEVFQ